MEAPTTQKDAEEMLVYMYKQRLTGQPAPTVAQLTATTKWMPDRVIAALDFLLQRNFIEGKSVKAAPTAKATNVIVSGVSTDGIDLVESPAKFRKLFGHEMNLGLYKYSWTLVKK
jgi:hypothetical protein